MSFIAEILDNQNKRAMQSRTLFQIHFPPGIHFVYFKHGLTGIRIRKSDYTHCFLWDVFTYPCPLFQQRFNKKNGVEVAAKMSNQISLFYVV